MKRTNLKLRQFWQVSIGAFAYDVKIGVGDLILSTVISGCIEGIHCIFINKHEYTEVDFVEYSVCIWDGTEGDYGHKNTYGCDSRVAFELFVNTILCIIKLLLKNLPRA
jgi:hypothetical protein